MWIYVAAYLALINAATFAAFAYDKRCAGLGERRVPERVLLNFALAGGTPAALAAMPILRHKTRKQPFRATLFTIWTLQALVLLALIAWSMGWVPAGMTPQV